MIRRDTLFHPYRRGRQIKITRFSMKDIGQHGSLNAWDRVFVLVISWWEMDDTTLTASTKNNTLSLIAEWKHDHYHEQTARYSAACCRSTHVLGGVCNRTSVRTVTACAVERKEKKNYAGVTTPQARIKEMETELSDNEVLTLPGGFEPATLKSLAWPRATRLSGQLPCYAVGVIFITPGF
jgi:hypothetical protein